MEKGIKEEVKQPEAVEGSKNEGDEVKGNNDSDMVTEDGKTESVKLSMDNGGTNASSLREEPLVSETEEISPQEHSVTEVCKTEIQEEVPADENVNSNKNTTQEEPNRVTNADENDVDCDVAAGVLNNNTKTDRKTPMKSRGESNQEGLQKSSGKQFVSEKNGVDNDVSHAGNSTQGFETVRGGMIFEEDEKEGLTMMENSESNLAFGFDSDSLEGGESGTEEEQSAFMKELERFFKEAGLEFKPPKFYGEPLNLLKLWRAVIKLGGYDKVTACKLWRQVGESFRPPKTCTTVSWTFRIFYEKALLDYEKHRSRGGELNIPPSQSGPGSIETQTGNSQAPGSGRARRDAAARAMQGWHSQRLLSNGEVGDPIIKDKSPTISMKIREKHLKNIGVQKRKWPSAPDVPSSKASVRPKVTKTQSDSTTIIDIGPPADWVKINVKTTKDCYEVYALVPGLLREEVQVQTDPAGRLVITGDPEHADNPWGVTPFKKVVSLPSRIDPHQTSAVVTLHGQLFVRVPFEQLE